MVAAAVKKVSKPKKVSAHPKYSAMIATAIATLKNRTGSSRAAILKSVVANNKVDATKAAVQVRLSLKRGVAKGALKMASASGKNAGSYKLVVKAKKAKKPAAKQAKKPKAAKQPAAKKAAKKPAAKKVAKKPAAKKPAAKKPAAKKPAAKKPAAKKAAKKPAAKKVAPKKK
jgi:hypothetical protein